MSSDDQLDGNGLDLAYVPKSQRIAHRPADRRTCYEVSRDAKVSRILHDAGAGTGVGHGLSQSGAHYVTGTATSCEDSVSLTGSHPLMPSQAQTSHVGESALPYGDVKIAPSFVRAGQVQACPVDAAASHTVTDTATTAREFAEPAISSAPYNRGRGWSMHRSRCLAGRRGSGWSNDPQEQQRYRTYQRNMYVLRNALKEVDPATKELVQLAPGPGDSTTSHGHCDGMSSGSYAHSTHRNRFHSRGNYDHSNYMRGGAGSRGYRGRGYSTSRGVVTQREGGGGRGGAMAHGKRPREA